MPRLPHVTGERALSVRQPPVHEAALGVGAGQRLRPLEVATGLGRAAKLAQEHAAGSFGVGIAGQSGQRRETGRRSFGTTDRDGARQRDHG